MSSATVSILTTPPVALDSSKLPLTVNTSDLTTVPIVMLPAALAENLISVTLPKVFVLVAVLALVSAKVSVCTTPFKSVPVTVADLAESSPALLIVTNPLNSASFEAPVNVIGLVLKPVPAAVVNRLSSVVLSVVTTPTVRFPAEAPDVVIDVTDP